MSDLYGPDAIRLRAEHCADHPHPVVARTARYILTGEEGPPPEAPSGGSE